MLTITNVFYIKNFLECFVCEKAWRNVHRKWTRIWIIKYHEFHFMWHIRELVEEDERDGQRERKSYEEMVVRFFLFLSPSFANLIVIWRYFFFNWMGKLLLYYPFILKRVSSGRKWAGMKVYFICSIKAHICIQFLVEFSDAKDSAGDDCFIIKIVIVTPKRIVPIFNMDDEVWWQRSTAQNRSVNAIFGMKKCDLNNDFMNDKLIGVEHQQ